MVASPVFIRNSPDRVQRFPNIRLGDGFASGLFYEPLRRRFVRLRRGAGPAVSPRKGTHQGRGSMYKTILLAFDGSQSSALRQADI